ncbi:MAG: tetratricopeptide repeat protein, partial [Anaerolineales bacterium]|nr:tetratricopeptide repeat protein [Anaerolineales bacterium]
LKEREIVFHEILGDAFFEQGEYKNAFDPYYYVLDTAEELKLDPLFLSKINIKLGDTADEEGLEIDQVSRFYHQALEVLSDAPNSFEKSYREIHAEQVLAYICERQGDCETVISTLSYLLTRAQILGQVAETEQQREDLTKLILDIYNNMGISYGNGGFFNHSVPMFVKAIDLAEARHNPRCTTFYLNMVDDLIRMGDFERGLQNTQKAMELARRNGNLDDQAFGEQSLGTICLMKKEYQKAVKHLQASIEMVERINAKWNIGYQYADLALAYSGLGLHAPAIEAVEKACQSAVERKYKYELAYTVLARAVVHNQAGDWEAAQAQFLQALDLLADKHYHYLYARCRREYGTALAEHGELKQGLEHLNAALEIFSELGIEVHYRLTEAGLDRFGQPAI